MKRIICCLVFIAIPSVCLAQGRHAPVDDIIREFDADGDGALTAVEVASHDRYSRQFVRWDGNQDGKVSGKEIVAMRAKFGIAPDGSKLSTRGKPKSNASSEKRLVIPDIADLARVERTTQLTREQAKHSAYILRTQPHPAAGESYVILTDHSDETYLSPLRRLAKHHNAQMISVDDLGTLHKDETAFASVRTRLIQMQVKHIAIAPRLVSFRENMVLGVWELLSTIDADPQLDCFPGFLIASNANAFSRLIDQSIDHKPIAPSEFRPFAINQVRESSETRSLQKSAILRKHFQRAGVATPIVAIYDANASDAPRLTGEQTWNMTVKARGEFVTEFPSSAQTALDTSNLVVMHGHGIPGMSCSVDIEGIPSDLQGKVLLSGSCFSACPVKSDLAAMREAPGGYQVEQRDAFVVRAIDSGAIVAFGHQRLSGGFPALYPVLESWTRGESVGQGYQQLINALIESAGTKSGEFIVPDQDTHRKRVPQNRFLYVVIGDPAMSPFIPDPRLQ